MSERTVSYSVVARVNSYLSGMEQVRAATAKSVDAQVKSKKSLDELGQSMTKVGTAAVGAGALAAAGLAIVVRTAAEYEAKMAQLKTLSHASAADMQRLSDAAMNAGKAYGFSATQVADAEIELTKAGVGVKQQLGGALTGALTLAAAGQIDVGQATEIATVAMTQFGLKAADIPHLADLLSAGADKALGSVGDLGEALKNGGLQAHNMGLTIDDTVGTLAAFANQGIIGAEAGTQLRSMFIQLQRPSQQAQEVLDKYGITLSDSSGKFVGITKLAGELQTQLGGLTQSQRNSALATVFGSHAIVGATALYQYGAKGIASWISQVNDTGFASAQAAGKLNSLQGDVTKLSAAFQTDLIKAGSGAEEALRPLVQTTTRFLGVIGDVPQPVAAAGTAVTVLVAGVGLLGGAALVAVPKVVEFRAALDELGISGKQAGKTFAKGAALSVGLSVIAAGLSGMGQQGTATAQQIEQTGLVARNSFKDLDKLFNDGTLGQGASTLKEALRIEGVESTGDKISSLGGILSGLDAGVLKNEGAFDALGQQLSGLAQSSLPAAQQAFRGISKEYDLSASDQQKLLNLMPAYKDELTKQAAAAHVSATDHNLLAIALGKGAVSANVAAAAQREAAASADKQAAEIAKLQGNAASATTSVQNLANTIKGFGSTTLDAHSAERAFQQAVDDATSTISKNGKTLDINSQAGRDNQAALEGIASAAIAAASAVETQTGNSKRAAQVVTDGRSAFIKQAEALGETKAAAERYADQLGLIPKNVLTAVKVTGTQAAETSVDNLLAKLNGIPRYLRTTVSVNQITSSSFNGTGPLVGKAAGGAITGPGPKGKDSVHILGAPGEHMLTASDVDAMGGQSGVYAFRAALHHMATGGAVSDAQKSVTAAKSALSVAQRAYNVASKKNKSDAKTRLDGAKQKLKDEQDRLTSLRNDREDFVSTQRRATADSPIDPLSYVDQLRSMSRDSNISASRQKAYDAAANKYEKSLVTLTTRADAAAQKLSDLKDASAQMKSSITSAIAGGYQASNAATVSTTSGFMVRNGIRFSTTSSGPTASSLASYYTQGATDTKTFAAQLKTLASRGVNAALLAEIAGYGVTQGAPIAAALLSASTSQLAQINSGYSAIQTNAAAAGTTVADDNYAKLITSAQKASDTITAQIASDGEKLRKLIASAFGLKGYASGTFSATPGLHLVGENGPEMLSFRGGERVWTASQTQAYIRGTRSSSSGSAAPQRQPIHIHLPDTFTVKDMQGFEVKMQNIADKQIAADAHLDSVLLG